LRDIIITKTYDNQVTKKKTDYDKPHNTLLFLLYS